MPSDKRSGKPSVRLVPPEQAVKLRLRASQARLVGAGKSPAAATGSGSGSSRTAERDDPVRKEQGEPRDFSEFVPQAAKRSAGACPLCGNGPAVTPFKIGPAVFNVCASCAKPVFHAFGLVEWFGRRK